MLEPARRSAKTQSLSLRLDPKTKFILEFVARVKGQSITTVVERALKEAADNVSLGSDWDEAGNRSEGRRWIHFWDPSEGVRTLRLLAEPAYPTNFDEDDLRDFTLVHWQFFYTDVKGASPRRSYIDILWPKIETYFSIWQDQKDKNYWAAGEAMTKDIRAARVQTPEWPPTGKPKLVAAKSGGRIDPSGPPPDFDDEIPF